jgi:dTDP-4-dehydrorhamnose 3,5-epimerase
MKISIESVHLGAVVTLQPEFFEDHRGFFLESFRVDQMAELGLPSNFVQDNHSGSVKGVTRGLHFQWEPAMSKLMRVPVGEAFLVAVDIRKGSPTLGQWYGEIISAENKKQLWAPAGFARGFTVLSDWAEIQYKVTGLYNPKAESGILWNDPEIGIEWPVKQPILSEKDEKAQTLSQWLNTPESDNFIYKEDEYKF